MIPVTAKTKNPDKPRSSDTFILSSLNKSSLLEIEEKRAYYAHKRIGEMLNVLHAPKVTVLTKTLERERENITVTPAEGGEVPLQEKAMKLSAYRDRVISPVGVSGLPISPYPSQDESNENNENSISIEF